MTYTLGAAPVQQELATVAEVRELYRDVFGIDVPADAVLDAKLASVLPTTSS